MFLDCISIGIRDGHDFSYGQSTTRFCQFKYLNGKFWQLTDQQFFSFQFDFQSLFLLP